jgi:hypothetical protein
VLVEHYNGQLQKCSKQTKLRQEKSLDQRREEEKALKMN